MASRTVCLQRASADIHGTDLGPLAATDGESGGLRDGAASGQVTARKRSAQRASDQRHFRRRRADGGWCGGGTSLKKPRSLRTGGFTTGGKHEELAGGAGNRHSSLSKTKSRGKYWKTNYGNWVKFIPPSPRKVAAGAVEVEAPGEATGADDVVDAGVERRGGDPKPPQEMEIRKGTKGCATRAQLEASLAAAVTSGYVCALCVHKVVGCGCPEYEAKMAAVLANRRNETAGNKSTYLQMGTMLVIALAAGLLVSGYFGNS